MSLPSLVSLALSSAQLSNRGGGPTYKSRKLPIEYPNHFRFSRMKDLFRPGISPPLPHGSRTNHIITLEITMHDTPFPFIPHG